MPPRDTSFRASLNRLVEAEADLQNALNQLTRIPQSNKVEPVGALWKGTAHTLGQYLLQWHSFSETARTKLLAQQVSSWHQLVAETRLKEAIELQAKCHQFSSLAFVAGLLDRQRPGDQLEFLAGNCEAMLQILNQRSPIDTVIYENQQKIVPSYNKYMTVNPPSTPLTDEPPYYQLLSLADEHDILPRMAMFQRWSDAYVKKVCVHEMISSGKNHQQALQDYSSPSDVKRMEIFLRYAGTGCHTIHLVARSHGKLLGFANDHNELPSASLAHASRINKRFHPQSRF